MQLGAFALGDALEGTIGELDGSFGFTVPAGGVQLGWDSRAVGTDGVGFGDGWSLGLTTVRVSGGVQVFPASGGAFAMDASVPSGLAGYPGTNVVFARAERGAVVPARSHGSIGETPYDYVLHELGGVSTYFDEAGFPVARLVLGGDRVDWQWETGGTGRLRAVITADGSVTALDWTDPSRVVIEPGSTVTSPVDGSGVGGRWVVELDGGRVSAVVDPMGARTQVGYGRSGLVERVSAPSGASTVVAWQASSDGVARVEGVRSVDEATGAELSVREWSVRGEALPSGWPLVSFPVSAGSASAGSGAVLPWFETSVSDGKTRVRSLVDGLGRLAGRSVVVSSSSGERVVQEQEFGYPEVEGPVRPGEELKPTSAATTYHDAWGGSRSVSESYGFDELGRMVTRTAVDGSVVRRVFDEVVATGRVLPVGLVVEETTTAPDGLVASSRSELGEDRASVVAAEQWSGHADGELVRTGRVETEVEAGFVVEERVLPGGDPAATPVVTRWSKQVDLDAGARRVTRTVAAGTAIEASTVSVSSLVHGATLTETDAVGNVARAEYDLAGRQTVVQDAAGRSSRYAYRTRQADGFNAVTVTDDTGVAVTETRDVLGRVVRAADNIAPSGRATEGFERVFETREYEPGVERVTDAWGAVTTTEQDVFGRTTQVTLPNGVVKVAEYDDVAGTATSGVSATGALADAELTSTSVLDTAGRVTSATGTRADGVPGAETSTVFDGFGREVRSADGVRDTVIEYDVFGNAAATKVAPLEGIEGGRGPGVTAEREFDGFGMSVEKTLRSDTATYSGQRRELDVLGRVISQTDQGGVTEVTGYTPDGLVAEVLSDTGRVAVYEYDPTSRALVGTRVSSPDAAPVATSFRHDAAGRLVGVFDSADEAGTWIGYEYDDFGNLTRTVYPDGAEVRHEFDPHGRKTATIDTGGSRTEYAYDSDGSLLAATQTGPDGAPVAGVRYAYDEYGRGNLLERDNGVRTEYTFTSAAEVKTETTTGPEGVLSEREYEYAPTGTLSARIDRVRDDAGVLQATRTDYEYDGHDRLIRSEFRTGESPVGAVLTRAVYEPTIGGDLASETVTTAPDTPEQVSITRGFEYSAVGELVAITTDGVKQAQEFDPHGNLTATATGARYGYDSAGRPVTQTTPDGVEIATTYWADGSRREHTTQAGSTRYYWDGDRLLNDVHGTAGGEQGTASYLIGTSRQARTIRPDDGGSSTSYYGADRHGNITDLTDHTGTIITSNAYTDYGVRTITGDQPEPLPAGIGELGYNPFGYAGEYTSRDGTQSLGPRIYDTHQARFTSKDDAPLANLYAYADLNPITNIDPTGRAAEKDWKSAFMTTVGYLIALGGAVMMLGTPGLLFSAFGVIGFAIGVGEAVLTGVHIAQDLIDEEFTDHRALEVTSTVFFGASFLVGMGGVIGAMAKRGTGKVAKTCMELMDFGCFPGAKAVGQQGSSGLANDIGAVPGQLRADEFYARQQSILGWKVSLKQAKLERLPTFEDEFVDAALTVNMQTAKDALLAARTTAVDASGSSLRFATARDSFDHLIVSESKITTLVEFADKQLGSAQSRLAAIAKGGGPASDSANMAFGELDGLRYELGTLLGKKPQVLTLPF